MKRFIALAAACVLCGCATRPANVDHHVGTLRLIGEQRIAPGMAYDGTTVGGLSGIDYDRASGHWVMVSDDRSALQPARFYDARLTYDADTFGNVDLTAVHYLRQQDGSLHPALGDFARVGGTVLDLESIRVDPRDGTIWYTSEGDVRIGLDPVVRHARADGTFIGNLPLPPQFHVARDGDASGARNNLNLEGLCFAPDGASLWLALEAPLVEDGPAPTPATGALTRMTQLDRSGRVLGQYAYPVDAIPAAPAPGKVAENGVSEILAAGAHTLLVLERAAVQGADGTYRNYIRVYEMDVRGATDVAPLATLRGAAVTPVRKRLVLDLNTLGLPALDNIEGFAWGPRLANGHDSLVFVSDDNFNSAEVTQLLLFEVLP